MAVWPSEVAVFLAFVSVCGDVRSRQGLCHLCSYSGWFDVSDWVWLTCRNMWNDDVRNYMAASCVGAGSFCWTIILLKTTDSSHQICRKTLSALQYKNVNKYRLMWTMLLVGVSVFFRAGSEVWFVIFQAVTCVARRCCKSNNLHGQIHLSAATSRPPLSFSLI